MMIFLRDVGVLQIAILLTVLAPAAGAADDTREYWNGMVDALGQKLQIIVVFTPAEDDAETYTARITIPIQSFIDQPLSNVTYTGAKLAFSIPAVGAEFTAERSPDGRTAAGVLQQRGMEFPLKMERVTAEVAATLGPERPQTPQPPFPYAVREVTYENPKDEITLAGTLTIPEGDGPHPAVVLISGSGPQDRDETIFAHKPFWVLADHLSRRGIAVLRVDDRGVGGSTGSTPTSTSKGLANDVIAGIRFLKTQPDIDPQRIGLVGHSEGGIIAPMVAAKSKSVACVVLLAGTGLPGDEILRLQTAALRRATFVPEEKIAQELVLHRQLTDSILNGADEATVRAAIEELSKYQLSLPPGAASLTPEQFQKLVDAALKQLQSNWMRFFMSYDPREALRAVKCPVLVLIGAKDLQVPPAENLPAIEQALAEAGNPDVTAKELPRLNHLFQEAVTGTVQEYATIEQTLSPTALDEITTWLRARFRLD